MTTGEYQGDCFSAASLTAAEAKPTAITAISSSILPPRTVRAHFCSVLLVVPLVIRFFIYFTIVLLV